MAAFSAADLQRRHELEGTPDPFPSLDGRDDIPPQPVGSDGPSVLDTESAVAFPSLAPSAPAKLPASQLAWSNTPRINPTVVKTTGVSDSFDLAAVDLSRVGRDNKPGTLSDAMKTIMFRFKVKVEASTQRKSGYTTFFIKGESEREVEKAKRQLIANLSPHVLVKFNVPASTIPSIIGSKGATLKQIRDQTGVKVDIPRRDAGEIDATGNGYANGASPRPGTPTEDNEESLIPITVQGAASSVEEAKAHILAIVTAKTSKTSQRIRDIPAHLVSFVLSRQSFYKAAATPEEELHLFYKSAEREISIEGDRNAVNGATERVKLAIEDLTKNLKNASIQLPKRQHHLLMGDGIQEIFVKSRCTVTLPDINEDGEEVRIWGFPHNLSSGLQAVMERANSQYIHEFPLPGPVNFTTELLTYIEQTSYTKVLAPDNQGVTIYLPSLTTVSKKPNVNVEFVGEKAAVDSSVRKLSELIGRLHSGTKTVEIDWLLHQTVQGRNSKKLKQLHDAHNVTVYFPQDSAESSSVVLVYDPFSSSASSVPDEKIKHLEEVSKELQKMVKESADVKSVNLQVDRKWHDAIIGWNGTTLNDIIGEDHGLVVRFGAEARKLLKLVDSQDDDIVAIRGVSADVDRASNEILRIVQEAKNEEIDNSYVGVHVAFCLSVEFEIPREFVGKIVGTQGTGVNRYEKYTPAPQLSLTSLISIREQLSVKLDFQNELDEKEKEKDSKKKKNTNSVPSSKSKVKIVGKKENVEEAKRRILANVERLVDETAEVIRVPRQYHASIIGQSGKYVLRLEEKYGVKITFGREGQETSETGKSRESLKSDEVLIKGGKKGVSGAKAEILDACIIHAVEFEKESNNTLTFTVPARTISRILGKGGASIAVIRDETDAQIDVEKPGDGVDTVTITAKGTKKAISAAKAAILSIVENITAETVVNLTIENKYHRSLIGAGGQELKDLIIRCGGPADGKAQATLVHFPRQSEPSDEVRLRGEPTLVQKVKTELEKAVEILRDRVISGVIVPSAQHKIMIGRGGQHLNELQDRHKTQIQFPGSRSYQQIGDPQNAAELEGADPADIVKVLGPKIAVEKTIDDIKKQIRAPPVDTIKEVISVPLKYQNSILQQGNLIRNLRSYGVHVDYPAVPSNASNPPRRPSGVARIDDDDSDPKKVQWEVLSNYQDAEEGSSDWTLRAKDQAALDKAKSLIDAAIERAQKAAYVGFLTVSDRSVFPRIVGSKGSNVSRLRLETGADITVGRDDNIITIVGPKESLQAAKEAIIEIVESRGRKN
ncbi:hypothetical protein Clacol_000534 [Clathrus columnatus]|uniref:PASTA domain-containing protein n=1 Tax=Clathrus columnatus TaxID=1419009 RepID=A0AAV5A136_9AGAM|nr:hypothetical protein Clacol_000534 [Clathrus columnatus]